MISLGFLPGVPGPGFAQESTGYAVSADGSVMVGDSSSSSGFQAFRRTTAGGMVGLGFLPGFSLSSAHGVSADGSVVVGGGNNGDAAFTNEAFRWTSGAGMVGLGFPGGSPPFLSSQAAATSKDGSVVVGNSTYSTSSP
jgi:probable HAF family extracellular repeat protein